MQHYDGPAFYRKQNKKVKPKVNEELPKSADKINNKKSQVFHPSYVPPSFVSWQYPAKKRKQKYQNLFERLQKKANDYLLFDESEPVEKSKIKIIAENELDTPDQKSATIKMHVTKEVPALESKPTTVDNFDNDEKDHVDSATDNVLNRQYLSENKSVQEKPVQEKPVQEKPVQEKSEEAIKDNGELDIVKSTPVSEKNEMNKTASDEIKAKQIKLNDRNKSQEISDKQDTGAETTEKVDMIDNVPAGIQKDDTEKSIVNVKEKLEEATSVSGYEFPDMNLLPKPVQVNDDVQDEWVLEQIDTLNETLEAFHVDATVKDWTIGPAVTQFELTLGRGVKVNKITNLIDDLKLALAAKDIRIEAPIPGRSSVGIEIPNLKPRPVMLSEVLNSTAFASKSSPLTVALGVNLSGESIVTDLRKMPHGLIAGATGSGKSVFINSILISLLYKATPRQVKLLLIDPKAVEMAPYHDIPHLLAPVISDPVAASAALKWVVEEMEERYQKLAAAGVRNIEGFNKKVIDHEDYGLQMPYIVIIIDELADLMMIASSEVQDYIARITQKARAAGIHLLIATQRPSVDVITGTIKNNIPTRVAFMVSSQIDSRTIIDTAGAERLLGRGDMLYLGNGASQPIRLQGTYVQNEVESITDFVRTQGQPQYAFDPDGLKKQNVQNKQEDEILPEVLDCLVNEDSISTSKLQRIFAIGYNRAANIIDTLEERRYISPARGSKPRDVYLTQEGLDKLRENNDY